jgi:glycosyltransferase involved in cell wall biosynthesis
MSEISFRNLSVIYGSSTDGTKEIAEKCTKKVFWDEDKGLGATRNLGVRKAVSAFVAIIDTDVVTTKDWCKHLIAHFEDPKVAAVIETTLYGYGCPPIQRLFEYWQWTIPEGYGCTNTIFKRDSVLKVGNFDGGMHVARDDYDLHKLMLAAGYKWVWAKKLLFIIQLTYLNVSNTFAGGRVALPIYADSQIK